MYQVLVWMPWMLSQQPRILSQVLWKLHILWHMGTYIFEFRKQALFINESLNGLAAAQGRWYGEYLACFMQEERWSNLAKVNVLNQRLSDTSALIPMTLGSRSLPLGYIILVVHQECESTNLYISSRHISYHHCHHCQVPFKWYYTVVGDQYVSLGIWRLPYGNFDWGWNCWSTLSTVLISPLRSPVSRKQLELISWWYMRHE